MTLLERIKTNPPPPVLFHYTTQVGVLGILENNCLWATEARYLNDSSEYSYGLDLITEVLRERSLAATCQDERHRFDDILGTMPTVKPMNVCVASLSEEGDLLSQWRAYGGSSGGFAVGLRAQVIRDVAHEQMFYLVKCIYTPAEQHKVVNDLIEEFRERMNASADWGVKEQGGGVASASRLALMLKNESFEQEREWRLMSMPKMFSELRFRQGMSMMVPFVNFALGSNRNVYLDSITVGPAPHAELAAASVQMLLRKLELSDPDEKVVGTRIPYRNW
jgi:hypothetical protein